MKGRTTPDSSLSNATDTIYYDIQPPEYEPQLTTIRRLDTRTNRYNLIGTIQNQRMILSRSTSSGGPTKQEGQWIKKAIGGLPVERCEGRTLTAQSGLDMKTADKGYGDTTMERRTSSLGRPPVALWRYVNIYRYEGKAAPESCHKLRRADKGVKTERGLATFHPHRRYLMVGWISQHAYLEIDNSIVDSVDAIIREEDYFFSFVQVLNHARRSPC
ncbi:hypothetical protein EDD17DRAFT_331636 [Pisolithus thermaeus]|nr:hypothetical protein EDD17DRAFT_331636 [Pisolithus thermaeus]